MIVLIYLLSIVAANLLIVEFGVQMAIWNALVFISLDLTTRDILHERWGNRLKINMALLILSGSVLSAALNMGALRIAIASFFAFSLAGLADTVIYARLWERSRIAKINGSNIGSSIVDSFVFPILAFGFPIRWGVIAGMIIAKILGGAFWGYVYVAVIKPSAHTPEHQ